MDHLEEARKKARTEFEATVLRAIEVFHEATASLEKQPTYEENRAKIREPKEPTQEERNAAAREEYNSALAAGKKVKVQIQSYADGEWENLQSPSFNGHNCKYRIVELPAPKFVPFTRENCPVGKVIISKITGDRMLIIGASEEGPFVGGDESPEEPGKYDCLLENYTMDDGSPCGTEVRE